MDPVSAPFPSSGVAKASELGLKVERRVSALLEEATDPALLAAMAAAQLSFPLTRHGLWKSLPKSFGHGSSVLRVGTATLGAFATEGLAFVGTHRSLAQASGISWREELRHTYLTLGLLRAFGGSTAQALRSAKLRHPVLLQGAPQASAYAGIYLSNSLASYLHWAEPMASGENGIQSLLTLIQFKGVEGILRLSPSFQGLHFPIQQASDRMIQGSRLLPSPFGSGIGPQRGPLWGGEGWALAAARNPRALSNPHLVFMDGSRSTGVSHFGIRIKSGEGYNWSKNARPDLAQLEAMIGETLQREFGSTLSGMNANTLAGRVIRFPDGKGVVWETLLKQYSHARWLRDHPGEYLSQRKAYEQRGYTVADSYDYFIREVLKQGPAEEFQLSSGEGYPWKKGAPPQIGPLEKMLKEILFVQFAGDVAKVNFNQIAKKIYLMPDGKTVSGRRILYQYAYARFLREHPGHRGSREQALRTQGYTPNDALQVFLRQHRHTPVSALLHSLAETAPATHTAKSSDPILDPLIFRSADYGPKAKRDPVTAERAFYHSLLRNSDKKLRDDLFYWVSGPALESALKVYASWEGLKHLPRGFRLGSVRVRAGQIKKLQSGQLTERDWRDINLGLLAYFRRFADSSHRPEGQRDMAGRHYESVLNWIFIHHYFDLVPSSATERLTWGLQRESAKKFAGPPPRDFVTINHWFDGDPLDAFIPNRLVPELKKFLSDSEWGVEGVERLIGEMVFEQNKWRADQRSPGQRLLYRVRSLVAGKYGGKLPQNPRMPGVPYQNFAAPLGRWIKTGKFTPSRKTGVSEFVGHIASLLRGLGLPEPDIKILLAGAENWIAK